MHGIARRLEKVGDMTCGNSVPLTESLENVHPLWCQLPYRVFGVEIIFPVCSFNEPCFEELIADRACHFFCHGEGCRCRRCHYPRAVLWIRHPVRLREFEGTKIRNRFFRCECVINPLETNAVRSER